MAFSAEHRSAWWAWLLPLLLGCSSPDGRGTDGAPAPTVATSGAVGSAHAGAPCNEADVDSCSPRAPAPATPPSPVRCDAPIPIVDRGDTVGAVCEGEAAARGLTVIDLSETWAPRVLAGDATHGAPAYRERYVQIAREELGPDPSWDRERRDRWFELYGVWPTFQRVAMRLGDADRHACHAALDDAGLASLAEPIDTWRARHLQRADRIEARKLEARLREAAASRGVALDDLAKDPARAAELRAFHRLRAREDAIRGMQERLRCERLLGDAAEAGILDEPTIHAMEAWFRRHMVVAWQLDPEVRDILLTDSRELDLRQALRVLRARVVDATGIIEDGSTTGVRGTVVGHTLDTGVFARSPGEAPLDGGAPDLVSRATDEVARALGWTAADAVLGRITDGLPPRVAVRLSPAPSYHAPHMDLVAVIDRGDVVLDPPASRARALAEAQRRELPSLVLSVRHGGAEIPLLRFPTTIGGWQPEVVPGTRRVQLAYKESPVGPRLWRDIVAAPAWIPPPSTPARDLVRPSLRGGFTPKLDTFGPHYASAYGLVMLIHHQASPGSDLLHDDGIRTHGSSSYASIFEGTSHGCHRLHNHRALELAGFLLAHRNHAVRGPIQLDHTRTFAHRGKVMRLEFPSRGFRYELDPPIDVEVRPGRVVGDPRTRTDPIPLPPHLARRYAFD